ncbi:MAG: hypothetical protein M3362_02900 [Acidobacteriota bacterium]|nr:hypothetical protein [Acidobacteriota bacterium]
MANDNPREISLEKNAEPDEAPNATGELNPANDQRTLDIGESGQFAPGGYYNQHGVVESERLDLDEYTATRPPDDKSES